MVNGHDIYKESSTIENDLLAKKEIEYLAKRMFLNIGVFGIRGMISDTQMATLKTKK